MSEKQRSEIQRVSVIIPFYSHVEWLYEAVESVLQQTYPVYEILVVNDGSLENMEAFLLKYGKKVRYLFQNNAGPAAARNRGIEEGKGDFIAFLDSDDLWKQDKLSTQIKEMVKTGAKWSACSWETFGSGKRMIYKMLSYGENRLCDYRPDQIATPSVIVRADILRQDPELRFGSHLRYGEDSLLWMKLIASYDVLLMNDILVQVREHGNNAAKSARVQMCARADLWQYRTEHPQLMTGRCAVNRRFEVASEICRRAVKILKHMERKGCSATVLEWTARFLYAFPYAIFKINNVCLKKAQR